MSISLPNKTPFWSINKCLSYIFVLQGLSLYSVGSALVLRVCVFPAGFPSRKLQTTRWWSVDSSAFLLTRTSNTERNKSAETMQKLMSDRCPKESLHQQSRRHGGPWRAYTPNNAPSPPKWNMKHYKSVEFCQFLQCQAPLHRRKPPVEDFLATVLFTRRFCAHLGAGRKCSWCIVFCYGTVVAWVFRY